MGDYTEEQLELLRNRWPDDLMDLIWAITTDDAWHLSKPYEDLVDAMSPLPEGLEPFGEKDLRGAPFPDTNLSGADLMDAEMHGANLYMARLSGAYLVGADLEETILMGANLSGANLLQADLSGATLEAADLTDANLMGADLSGANLKGVNLSGANLLGAKYTTDEIFDRLRKNWIPRLFRLVKCQRWKPLRVTSFEGVDTRKVDWSKNPALRRHIEDFQFIQAFRGKGWFHGRIVYPLWRWTCDCGRSLLLWAFWSVILALFFAGIYSKNLEWFRQSPDLGWFDVLYFSVVTFTTLGFGDVTPHYGNITAQAWIMAEVIIGYIMLGGLISILANKLARRA